MIVTMIAVVAEIELAERLAIFKRESKHKKKKQDCRRESYRPA